MPNLIVKNNDISTRRADIEELTRARHSRSAKERMVAEKALHNISHESRKTRSMREALIKAHRSGNNDEVKDIHEYIRNKSEYRNER